MRSPGTSRDSRARTSQDPPTCRGHHTSRCSTSRCARCRNTALQYRKRHADDDACRHHSTAGWRAARDIPGHARGWGRSNIPARRFVAASGNPARYATGDTPGHSASHSTRYAAGNSAGSRACQLGPDVDRLCDDRRRDPQTARKESASDLTGSVGGEIFLSFRRWCGARLRPCRMPTQGAT